MKKSKGKKYGERKIRLTVWGNWKMQMTEAVSIIWHPVLELITTGGRRKWDERNLQSVSLKTLERNSIPNTNGSPGVGWRWSMRETHLGRKGGQEFLFLGLISVITRIHLQGATSSLHREDLDAEQRWKQRGAGPDPHRQGEWSATPESWQLDKQGFHSLARPPGVPTKPWKNNRTKD